MPDDRGFVLLVTGPAGAGKSAAAAAWAARQRRPAMHVSLDDVRDLVKSSYANPEDGATPEMWRQLAIARRGCAMLAKLYAEHGFLCAIDDAIFPDWEPAGYERWQTELAPLQHRLVVLLPRLEAILERNRARSGHRRLREETLRVIYERMLPWRERQEAVLLDNSDFSIAETAERLDSLTA
jgi:hypothetical protein